MHSIRGGLNIADEWKIILGDLTAYVGNDREATENMIWSWELRTGTKRENI